MDKRMFVTPGDSALGAALADAAIASGWRVASTVNGDVDEGYEDENRLVISCNNRSLLSARRAFLDCLNAFQGIDAAIVLHEVRQDERPVHELAPIAIEEYFDIGMKERFFVLREILSLFVRQRSGILAMVNYAPEDFTLLPLCAAAAGAFRAATDSLATLYQNENIIINGFDCTSESPERYSRFILEQLSGKAAELSGKWYHCGGAPRLSRSRKSRK